MKSEVVILSCESYEEELVYSTLKKGIALLGGWETFLEKEEKISCSDCGDCDDPRSLHWIWHL